MLRQLISEICNMKYAASILIINYKQYFDKVEFTYDGKVLTSFVVTFLYPSSFLLRIFCMSILLASIVFFFIYDSFCLRYILFKSCKLLSC